MKKILTLLTLVLLSCMGAWAQRFIPSGAPEGNQWAKNTQWYYIINGDGKGFMSVGSGYTDTDGNIKLNQQNRPSGDEGLWCIVGNSTDGYKFYNKSKGTTYTMQWNGSTSGTTGADARFKMVENATSNNVFDYRDSDKAGKGSFKIHGSTNQWLNNRAPYLSFWIYDSAYTVDGSSFIFEPAFDPNVEYSVYNKVDGNWSSTYFAEYHSEASANDVNYLTCVAPANISHDAGAFKIKGGTQEGFNIVLASDPTKYVYAIGTSSSSKQIGVKTIGDGESASDAKFLFTFTSNGTSGWIIRPKAVGYNGSAWNRYDSANQGGYNTMGMWQCADGSGIHQNNTWVITPYWNSRAEVLKQTNASILEATGRVGLRAEALKTAANEAYTTATTAIVATEEQFNAFNTAFNNFKAAPVTVPSDGYYRVKSCAANRSLYNVSNSVWGGISYLWEDAVNSKYIYKIDFEQSTTAGAQSRILSMTSSLGEPAKKSSGTQRNANDNAINIAPTDVESVGYQGANYVENKVWVKGLNVNTGANFSIEGTGTVSATNPNFAINWGSGDQGRGATGSNVWTFEPVEASKVYTIRVTGSGPQTISITYNGATYEGNATVATTGFFYFDSAPESSAFTATENPEISIDGNVITLTYPKDWDTYKALYDQLDAYTIGTGLGEYADITKYSDEYSSEWPLSGWKSTFALDYKLKTDARFNSNMEAMQWFIEHMTLNMPKNGSFIRIHGYDDAASKYLLGTVNGNNRLAVGDKSNEAIFYYGDGKLITFTSGRYVNLNSESMATLAAIGTTGAAVEFREDPAKSAPGIYNVKIANWTQWIGGSATEIAASTDWRTGKGWRLQIEEVEELPVNIAAGGFGTFYTPVPVRAASGVKVYTATVEEGETPETTTITYTELENGEIPANTAVLVKGEAGVTTMTIIDATSNTVSENALIGKAYTEATPTQGDGGKYIYTLTSSGAFKYYTGVNLAGFKCHLEIGKDFSGVSASNFRVVFTDGTLTGIDSAIITPASANVYDLLGRRVMNAQRGLYIVNGKKVIR